MTVLRRGEDLIKKNNKKDTRWYCSCDCGNPNEVLVLGYNLKNGNTTSCGCEHLKNAKRSGSLNKQCGKWETEISAYNSRVRLGYFGDINEAINIREQAEEKYFGEYNYKGGDVSYEEH